MTNDFHDAADLAAEAAILSSMSNRKLIPDDTQTDVLARSGRRCCICFGLSRALTEKRGQIAHLDQNPSNHDPDNLAFLCFDHHDRYDGRTSQSKGLTILEVKRYRTALHEAIERSQHGSAALPVAANPKQRSILEWKGKLVSVHRRQTIEASRRAGHVPRNQRDYRVTDCDEHCVRLHDTASGTNFAIPLEDLKINVDEERLGRLLLIQIV